MHVIYLHHTAAFGGSSKSLIELWDALRMSGKVQGTILCSSGPAARRFQDVGLDTIEVRGLAQWDDTKHNFYRGFRWLVLLRELLLWPGTLWSLWKLRRKGPFDLIHINELNLLLPGFILKKWLKVPLVVHVRALQRGQGGDFRTRWISRILAQHADAIIAIDETVRRTLPEAQEVHVIHNSLRVDAGPPKQRPEGPMRVAMIGTLLATKGVFEFMEAAHLCAAKGANIQFLVVGENVRTVSGLRGWLLKRLNLSRDVRAELESYVGRHGLSDRVTFTGFIDDVQSVYRTIDVLCFPSHLDAPGRPVFEAAFFGVPSVVAVQDPTADTLVPGVTGICLSNSDPTALADALLWLSEHPDERQAMGAKAMDMAKANFNPALNANRMISVYNAVVCGRI